MTTTWIAYLSLLGEKWQDNTLVDDMEIVKAQNIHLKDIYGISPLRVQQH